MQNDEIRAAAIEAASRITAAKIEKGLMGANMFSLFTLADDMENFIATGEIPTR